MGDYNADGNPNVPQAEYLCRQYGFVQDGKILFDQWSLDSATRVSGFHDGTNRHSFHVKYTANEIPPT